MEKGEDETPPSSVTIAPEVTTSSSSSNVTNGETEEPDNPVTPPSEDIDDVSLKNN